MMPETCEAVLVGLALGDALGAPLAFLSPMQAQIKHGVVREMIGGGWLGLRPGQYTSHTRLALLLAESLGEKRGLDLADLGGRYREWLAGDPPDADQVARAALEKLGGGLGYPEAARQAHEENGRVSGLNGPLARQAPLALFYGADLPALVRHALAEARLTHYDRRAGSAAACFGLCLAGAAGGERDRQKILAAARRALDESPEEVFDPLTDLAVKTKLDLKPAADAVTTLEAVLWVFLRAKSFEDCLVEVVNLGGESAAAGAAAGALGAAYWGPAGLPARWRNALQDHGLIVKAARRFAGRIGAGMGGS